MTPPPPTLSPNRRLRIPYGLLVPSALLLALLPLGAEPHLVEKVGMLRAGELRRPLDIFDLLMHGGLLAVLAVQLGLDLADRLRGNRGPTKGADPAR